MSDVDYRDWIGSREELEDTVTLNMCRQMAALLDETETDFKNGDPLPAMWHYCYFLNNVPMRDIGTDGHPKRGGFLPPVTLPRRMFANGKIDFLAPIPLGTEVRRVGEVIAVEEKSGKSGQLVFVTVKFDIFAGDTHCMEETQSYAYREMGAPNPAPVPLDEWPPMEGDFWMRDIMPDPVLLMRYSAVTYNGHRIHYDRPYAENEEQYPGLLVQGPLIATYMSELVRLNAGREMKSFSYRALAPIFDTGAFRVMGEVQNDDTVALQAMRSDGQIAQQATAVLA
jgi:3-methylfumaryl-CoA hydratase